MPRVKLFLVIGATAATLVIAGFSAKLRVDLDHASQAIATLQRDSVQQGGAAPKPAQMEALIKRVDLLESAVRSGAPFSMELKVGQLSAQLQKNTDAEALADLRLARLEGAAGSTQDVAGLQARIASLEARLANACTQLGRLEAISLPSYAC